MPEYEFHRYADAFPLLRKGEEFDNLVESIREHGQREPILLYDGKILDGRNRYLACKAAGVEPVVEEAAVESDEEALDLVIDLNEIRRHMTPSERAWTLSFLDELWEAEQEAARERQEAQAEVGRREGGDPGKTKKTPVGKVTQRGSEPVRPRDRIGERFGISGSLAERARKVREKYPEKAAEAHREGKTVSATMREIEEAHRKALAEKGEAFPKNVRSIISRLQSAASALEEEADTLFEPGHWHDINSAWVRLATVMRKVKRTHKEEYGS